MLACEKPLLLEVMPYTFILQQVGGGCYAYEGAKSGVYICKNYVTLVSPPQSTPSSGAAVS